MTKVIQNILLFAAALIASVIPAAAQEVVRKAAGPDAAAIQDVVEQFRVDLGGQLNPNVAQTFETGHREINWDGVPDGFSSPNALPANFFNANSPRGLVYSTPCESATFRVSAKLGNPTNTPVRFGEIDPSYTDTFKAFSPQRLFTVVGNGEPCSQLSVSFFAAGTNTPAETTGFGVIFSDVDIPGHTRFIAYDKYGNELDPGVITAERSNDGFSFIGVLYPEPKIARVDIKSGKTGLFPGILDSQPGKDVVAMDDFIYGEPQPIR